MTGELIDDERLNASAVVANCAMNRERQLAGVNSYSRELGINPVEWLIERIPDRPRVGWLDLCCGSGRALRHAAAHLAAAGFGERVTLVGVDLVDAFDPLPGNDLTPRFVCASITTWQPAEPFDLITCVHGLHYVGDKLGVLTRAASWLAATGLLVADFDLAAVRLADGRPAGRPLAAALRAAGFGYDPRRHRITRVGTGPGRTPRPVGGEVHLPYTYVGADDRAGPNYTGQPAVNSHYVRD